MVSDIGLSFVAQSETHCEVGFYLPIVSGEYRNVPSAGIDHRISGIDRELRRSAAQRPDLCRRETHLLKEQCPAVLFYRGDRCVIAVRLIVGIQNRSVRPPKVYMP